MYLSNGSSDLDNLELKIELGFGSCEVGHLEREGLFRGAKWNRQILDEMARIFDGLDCKDAILDWVDSELGPIGSCFFKVIHITT